MVEAGPVVSEGPIKQERAARLAPPATTKASERVCMVKVVSRRTHCGRRPVRGRQTSNWDDVTCSECLAIRRSDQQNRSA